MVVFEDFQPQAMAWWRERDIEALGCYFDGNTDKDEQRSIGGSLNDGERQKDALYGGPRGAKLSWPNLAKRSTGKHLFFFSPKMVPIEAVVVAGGFSRRKGGR